MLNAPPPSGQKGKHAMKIVVLDGYTENPGDLSWDALKAFGELTVYDRVSYEESPEIAEAIGDAEIVFTNKTPISRATLDACPQIRYISVLATGYNVVDVAAAKEKGIPVSNVPTYGTAAVGQFAIALLLEICHHIAHHSEAVHAGRWEANPDWCFWDYPLIELAGKTMGIIGFGKIGQTTGRIAKALGMTVLASGSRPTESGLAIAEYVERDELFARSDVICLHCPYAADCLTVHCEFHHSADDEACRHSGSTGKKNICLFHYVLLFVSENNLNQRVIGRIPDQCGCVFL
jgi:glycerate dehydrogenase